MHPMETGRTPSKEPPRLEVTSAAFRDGEHIPVRYTADGENVSPPLRWSEPPTGTRSFAIAGDDPDAPSGLFVHWLLWSVPPEQRSLAEAVAPTPEVDGMRQGLNGFGEVGYAGPKPPRGKPHRYRFHVYALDLRPTLRAGASRSDLEHVMAGHVLAHGVLVGKYGR